VTTFRTTLDDSLRFVGVEFRVMVIKFFSVSGYASSRPEWEKALTYPLIPWHIPEPHRDVVWSMSEWAVWIWFRGVDVPVWSCACIWPSKFNRFPHCHAFRSDSKLA
jgi:hypothetical protein